MDFWSGEERPHLRRCDHPNCADEGLYRAPKDRARLTEYYWFCLEHVRDYNSRWNYYAGMNEAEIEAYRRRDTVWERPSWPLGAQGHTRMRLDPERLRDFFDVLEEQGRHEERRSEHQPPRRGSMEDEALAVFDLKGPVTLSQVKARYKELVKLHHPDTNGGDKASEERLKIINQAYTTLKSSVSA